MRSLAGCERARAPQISIARAARTRTPAAGTAGLRCAMLVGVEGAAQGIPTMETARAQRRSIQTPTLKRIQLMEGSTHLLEQERPGQITTIALDNRLAMRKQTNGLLRLIPIQRQINGQVFSGLYFFSTRLLSQTMPA